MPFLVSSALSKPSLLYGVFTRPDLLRQLEGLTRPRVIFRYLLLGSTLSSSFPLLFLGVPFYKLLRAAMAASTTEPATRSITSSPTGHIPNVFVSLSSAFLQTPVVRLNKPNLLLLPPVADSIKLFQDLHSSLVSATEKFGGFLNSIASRNPLYKNAARLSSEFGILCDEIRSRNSRRVRFAMSNHGFAAVLPGDSVAGMVVANGLINFLNIYNTLLVVRLVLTWFPSTPPAIVSPLSTLCDPYLNIFRGFIPPLGGLDLSPILAFLVLNALTSTATALPCELPPAEGGAASSPSSYETKWMRRRRLSSQKEHRPSSADVN